MVVHVVEPVGEGRADAHSLPWIERPVLLQALVEVAALAHVHDQVEIIRLFSGGVHLDHVGMGVGLCLDVPFANKACSSVSRGSRRKEFDRVANPGGVLAEVDRTHAPGAEQLDQPTATNLLGHAGGDDAREQASRPR